MNASIERLERIRNILKIQHGRGSDTRLAKMLGVSKSTLSGWKNRDSLPFSICEQIARDYGQSLDWIMFGQGFVQESPAAHYQESHESVEERLIQDWLQEFLATASQQEKSWLFVQMKIMLPPFRDWLEKSGQDD